MAQVRLYRPFPADALIEALPSSVRRVAVLDRTKEPGSEGEPLFLDVVAALNDAAAAGALPVMPIVIGGRYGLSSKEFTPGMVAGVLTSCSASTPGNVSPSGSSTTSPTRACRSITRSTSSRGRPYGRCSSAWGADGTVGANKNTIKIMGDEGFYAQGYFVYDSKKSGSQTASHLRFGPEPSARRTWSRRPVSSAATSSASWSARMCWAGGAGRGVAAQRAASSRRSGIGSRPVQEQILAKGLQLYVINAGRVARDAGSAAGINTVLQTCFFAISGVLPREKAIERRSRTPFARPTERGRDVVEKNFAAVDRALAGCTRYGSSTVTGQLDTPPLVPTTRRVRPRRDRDDDGRPGRRAAGQRDAGRRHIPSGTTHTRSATSPTFPSWDADCASSAASAASSVRTA